MDKINYPPHYTQGEIECIDAIESAIAGLPPQEAFLAGQVIKYVWRYNHKENAYDDLGKARWYLNRLQAKVEDRSVQHQPQRASHKISVDPARWDSRISDRKSNSQSYSDHKQSRNETADANGNQRGNCETPPTLRQNFWDNRLKQIIEPGFSGSSVQYEIVVKLPPEYADYLNDFAHKSGIPLVELSREWLMQVIAAQPDFHAPSSE